MPKVRKAVFPVAGLGTRFLPATKSIPKEMLTVVDRPVIQYVVDEARQAGIEHLIFVTGRNKGVIEDYFDIQVELVGTLTERSKKAELELLDDLQPRAGTASFTRQQAPLGLGHAVWCARELVGNEPFALLLPDMIMQAEEGCLTKMVELYDETGGNIISVETCDPAETNKYGIVGRGADVGIGFKIDGMVEKPAPGEGALELLHLRPLHPAAGDLRHPGDAGKGRRQRDPADRRHAEARRPAGFLRLPLHRPHLRLRLEGRLHRGQRRLRALAPDIRDKVMDNLQELMDTVEPAGKAADRAANRRMRRPGAWTDGPPRHALRQRWSAQSDADGVGV